MSDTPTTTPTFYELMGKEAGVRALVDRFYDAMDQLPEVKVLRDMHPPDLQSSRDKLFMFMSGWLGGPPLYVQTHGHPRLRARHMPFVVDTAARDQWMMCMQLALKGSGLEAEPLDKLQAGIAALAMHMINHS